MLADSTKTLTVTELNQSVKNLVEGTFQDLLVLGEVSSFSAPASGHWYFTLKDQAAQVKCAMFRQHNQKYYQKSGQKTLQQGDSIVVFGTATLYSARGDYQLVVEQIDPMGAGLLQQKLEKLKAKLAGEGLFDLKAKQAIPISPRCIGVITSASGAALHDILHVLHRRDPSIKVIIYPSSVQGIDAVPQLIKAIQTANRRKECDVLIVGRGGGSLEDLWCFNDESVARALFASELPVISAVGHEVDFTIADSVADMRAATPSAAAEAISVDGSMRKQKLHTALNHLLLSVDYLLSKYQHMLAQVSLKLQAYHPSQVLEKQQKHRFWLEQKLKLLIQKQLQGLRRSLEHKANQLALKNPLSQVAHHQQKIDQALYRLQHSVAQQLHNQKTCFSKQLMQLQERSPIATLCRGFSWVQTSQGQLIRSVHTPSLGEVLRIRVTDGWINTQVTSIEPIALEPTWVASR